MPGNNEFFSRRREAYIGQTRIFSATSCSEILSTFPSSTSGYYWVGEQWTHCEFNLNTPSNDQSWERVMNLDMSDSTQSCPSDDFRVVEPPEGRGRYCIRRDLSNGCVSLTVPVGTQGFSRVYGRITGIQIGTTDRIRPSAGISSAYLDGVSLTTNYIGNRQHVWSFISAYHEMITGSGGCPCSTNSDPTVPGFVGTDYFCESGLPSSLVDFYTAFVDDPLWDGEQCNSVEASCCTGTVGSARSPPWFYKTFINPFQSGTNLEVRVCTDQDINDENVGLQLVELYVQ